MLDNDKTLTYSVASGLVYLTTLRQFCLNINFAFLDNNQDYKDAAMDFYRRFYDLTKELLKYANGVLSEGFLNSGILVSEYSLPLIELTEKLFESEIPEDILISMKNLKPGQAKNVSDETIDRLQLINEVSLVICKNFIDFLRDIFEKETNNELFSYSYPYLIRKMIEDVQIYEKLLERLVKRIDLDPTFAFDYEYFNVDAIRAYAMYLRSFIDPSRTDIIIVAQSYIIEVTNLLNEYKNTTLSPDNQRQLTIKSEKLAHRFHQFLGSIINQLLNSEIYLIVEPLFLDTMYRSINLSEYFIYDPIINNPKKI